MFSQRDLIFANVIPNGNTKVSHISVNLGAQQIAYASSEMYALSLGIVVSRPQSAK